jgi:hypothetical protein
MSTASPPSENTRDRARSEEAAISPAAAVAQLRALALANWRFWGGVAAGTHRELSRWREQAAGIEDRALRELALSKLEDEAFNAEVAATLATLAPKERRTDVVATIVALEVLFDYLDGRTERLFAQSPVLESEQAGSDTRADTSRWRRALPLGKRELPRPESDAFEQGRRLFAALGAVLSGDPPEQGGSDSEYIDALWRHAHEHVCALPGLEAVRGVGLQAALRCGEAQLRLHAAGAHGEEQLREWAERACADSGLEWREYAGGCASSVLAMHALIASAARPEVTEADARALDGTYLAVGAVITTLDSLVDESEDAAAGQAGYIRLYDGRREIEQRLLVLIAAALARSAQVRDGAHHAMTLAGVAAYYTTHPGAGEPQNRVIRGSVRRELAPTIWPALAVLSAWRAAKRLRRELTGLRSGPLVRGAGGSSERRGDEA